MAFVKIPTRDLLRHLFADLADTSVRVTGASYDLVNDQLVLNISGRGLPDFAEVKAESVMETETKTVTWYGQKTKFVVAGSP